MIKIEQEFFFFFCILKTHILRRKDAIFLCKGNHKWNQLPVNIVNFTGINEFKMKLDSHWGIFRSTTIALKSLIVIFIYTKVELCIKYLELTYIFVI